MGLDLFLHSPLGRQDTLDDLRNLADLFVDDGPLPLEDLLRNLRFQDLDILQAVLGGGVHDRLCDRRRPDDVLLGLHLWHLDGLLDDPWAWDIDLDLEVILDDAHLLLQQEDVDRLLDLLLDDDVQELLGVDANVAPVLDDPGHLHDILLGHVGRRITTCGACTNFRETAIV